MLMKYHIGRLVLSSLCVGAFVAAGIWWYSFCRLMLLYFKLLPFSIRLYIPGIYNQLCMFSLKNCLKDLSSKSKEFRYTNSSQVYINRNSDFIGCNENWNRRRISNRVTNSKVH